MSKPDPFQSSRESEEAPSLLIAIRQKELFSINRQL